VGHSKTNYMTRKFLVIIFLIGFVNQISAQTDTLNNNVFGGFTIFPIEFPIIDNQDLNSVLSGLGFPECDYSPANIGFGLQFYTNRWITTFSFNKTTKKNDSDNYLTEIEYRSTSLNLGYDLTKNYRFSLYPFFGFKGCGLNYLYRDKISNETSFNNYLNTTLEYKEITNSRANLDLGFGVSYQWFFLINFRTGYLLPLEKASWNINNNQDELSNSPTLSYNYYFTLTIGLGNIVSDDELRRHYNRNEL
jgi:hypothetical protein